LIQVEADAGVGGAADRLDVAGRIAYERVEHLLDEAGLLGAHRHTAQVRDHILFITRLYDEVIG